MSFISKKKLKEEIVQLSEQLADLKKIIVTDELNKLRQRSKEYDVQTELLSHVKFKVKEARVIHDEEKDTYAVRIVYDLPTLLIPIKEDGKAEKNDFFYSVNSLEMLDLNSLERLSNLFEKAKKQVLDKEN